VTLGAATGQLDSSVANINLNIHVTFMNINKKQHKKNNKFVIFLSLYKHKQALG